MTVTHNLADFHAAVDGFIAKHGPQVSIPRIQAKLGMDALHSATFYSPVLSGYLRYNWQLTVGQPAEGTKGRKGSEYPGSQAGQVDMAEARALAVIPPFSIVWLTNNAEYAEVVNNGGPNREAALMLERTVSDLTESLLTA